MVNKHFMFIFSGLTYGQVAILNVSKSEDQINNSSSSDETGESPTLSSTVTSLINQTISSVLTNSQVKTWFFFFSALLRNFFLCWDRCSGDIFLHLMRPCLVALGWILILNVCTGEYFYSWTIVTAYSCVKLPLIVWVYLLRSAYVTYYCNGPTHPCPINGHDVSFMAYA